MLEIGSVKIGSQIWMNNNLDTDRFRNGDLIIEAKTDEQWSECYKNGKPAWCYLNNDENLGKKYGRIYNWHAVADPRGLAPVGWTIPTWQDFKILIAQTGRDSNSLKAVGEGQGYGLGNNKTGFSALMAGCRLGYFDLNPFYTYFWSKTEAGEDGVDPVWLLCLYYNQKEIPLYSYEYGGHGYYVRCIQKNSKSEVPF